MSLLSGRSKVVFFFGRPLAKSNASEAAAWAKMNRFVAKEMGSKDPDDAVALCEAHTISRYRKLQKGAAGLFEVCLGSDQFGLAVGVIVEVVTNTGGIHHLEVADMVKVNASDRKTARDALKKLPKELRAFVESHAQGPNRLFAMVAKD